MPISVKWHSCFETGLKVSFQLSGHFCYIEMQFLWIVSKYVISSKQLLLFLYPFPLPSHCSLFEDREYGDVISKCPICNSLTVTWPGVHDEEKQKPQQWLGDVLHRDGCNIFAICFILLHFYSFVQSMAEKLSHSLHCRSLYKILKWWGTLFCVVAVDGYYLNWNQWNACSVTCGTGGTQTRDRNCVPPQNGGQDCVGPDSEEQECSEGPCPGKYSLWWRHQMETFSALLALCEGNSPVTGEFPSQRPVTRSFWCFLWSAPEQTLE